jgi:hypothetical protein
VESSGPALNLAQDQGLPGAADCDDQEVRLRVLVVDDHPTADTDHNRRVLAVLAYLRDAS